MVQLVCRSLPTGNAASRGKLGAIMIVLACLSACQPQGAVPNLINPATVPAGAPPSDAPHQIDTPRAPTEEPQSVAAPQPQPATVPQSPPSSVPTEGGGGGGPVATVAPVVPIGDPLPQLVGSSR